MMLSQSETHSQTKLSYNDRVSPPQNIYGSDDECVKPSVQENPKSPSGALLNDPIRDHFLRGPSPASILGYILKLMTNDVFSVVIKCN